MENVTLRTGKIAVLPLVNFVFMSFKSLFASKPIVAYELVMLCRDSHHDLFGISGHDLMELKLVETNGSCYYVRDEVRDIVMASVDGEGLDMWLVNPIGVQMNKTSYAMTKTASLEDYKLYCAVRRVADIICEMGLKHKLWFEDRRSEGANPFYNQTANGLFLEFYYGGPSSLWTPWGTYGFRGSSSGNWDKLWEELSGILGATLYELEQNTGMGCVGPVFALHKLDGGTLPEPTELARVHFDDYEKVKNAWEKMARQHQSK